MVNWIAINKAESEVFVESTNVEELRARRVWKFLLVTWLTWLVNGIFLWYRGYHVAAAVCLIDFLVHLAIVVLFWNDTKYRRVMNLNLAASGIGLFCISISNPAMAVTHTVLPGIHRGRLAGRRRPRRLLLAGGKSGRLRAVLYDDVWDIQHVLHMAVR